MNGLVEARMAAALPELGGAENGLPAEVQWAPPGEHEINGFLGGEPKSFKVVVNEAAAQAVIEDFNRRKGEAEKGHGDFPYLDFNHRGDEAAAQVQAVRWAGEDPKQGGIRLRVWWTGPGKAALEGKAYRRFSPKFFVLPDGTITGAPVNMGGLVNEAAFQTIQSVVAKKSDREERNNMDENKPLAEANAKILKLEADLAEAKESAQNAQAALATAREQLLAQAKASAEEKVKAAVAAGKIPPLDKERQERYVKAIVADASVAELLDALPVNPALRQVIAKAAPVGAPLDTPAHKQMALVREVQARGNGMSFDQAWQTAKAEKPELFA